MLELFIVIVRGRQEHDAAWKMKCANRSRPGDAMAEPETGPPTEYVQKVT